MKIAKKCVCCKSKNIISAPAVLMPFIASRIFNWKPFEVTEKLGLHSIPNGMVYSICKTIQCCNCRHLFLDMRFDDDEMNLLYMNYRGEEYVKQRELYEPGYVIINNKLDTQISYINQIENFLLPHIDKPLNILDYGGDDGHNTPFKNEKIFIYDISEKDVLKGMQSVNKSTVFNYNYDLLICSNVLEHIPYPDNIVKELKELMSNESILYIEVPYESIVMENNAKEDLTKKKYHWHEHINFFTKKSISILFKNNGFNIIDLNIEDVTTGSNISACIQLIVNLNK
jgi:hypothetical protein